MIIIAKYLPEFISDVKKFQGNDKNIIRCAIDKLRKNPLSKADGGYGKPLDNNKKNGLLSVKIIFTNIRIVYKLIITDDYILLLFVQAMTDSSSVNDSQLT